MRPESSGRRCCGSDIDVVLIKARDSGGRIGKVPCRLINERVETSLFGGLKSSSSCIDGLGQVLPVN